MKLGNPESSASKKLRTMQQRSLWLLDQSTQEGPYQDLFASMGQALHRIAYLPTNLTDALFVGISVDYERAVLDYFAESIECKVIHDLVNPESYYHAIHDWDDADDQYYNMTSNLRSAINRLYNKLCELGPFGLKRVSSYRLKDLSAEEVRNAAYREWYSELCRLADGMGVEYPNFDQNV